MPAKRKTNAFTLIELLVVVAIIALLVALLMPALKGARDKAKTVYCVGNLRQLALGVHSYCDDNGDYLPSSRGYYSLDPNTTGIWYPLLNGIQGSPWPSRVYVPHGGWNTKRGVYFCPANPVPPTAGGWAGWTTYAYNENFADATWDGSWWQGTRRTAVTKNNALFTDSYRLVGNSTWYVNTGSRFSSPWGMTYGVHVNGLGQNVVFLDGHVQWVKVEPHPPEPMSLYTDCVDMQAAWFWPLW